MPRQYAVQPHSGSAVFDYRVAMFTVTGRTAGVRAALDLSEQQLESAHGTITVALGGLKTGNALRDEHMRAALDSARHPDAVFHLQRLTGVTTLEKGHPVQAWAHGTLKLHGVTRPLTAPVLLTKSGADIKVSTAFRFDPHAFHVNFVGGDRSIDLRLHFLLARQ